MPPFVGPPLGSWRRRTRVYGGSGQDDGELFVVSGKCPPTGLPLEGADVDSEVRIGGRWASKIAAVATSAGVSCVAVGKHGSGPVCRTRASVNRPTHASTLLVLLASSTRRPFFTDGTGEDRVVPSVWHPLVAGDRGSRWSMDAVAARGLFRTAPALPRARGHPDLSCAPHGRTLHILSVRKGGRSSCWEGDRGGRRDSHLVFSGCFTCPCWELTLCLP